MSPLKPGDLVFLRSGGPTMTVDAVNTDIFDDDKITGIVCVWFVGEKLERVRFDPRAIDRAQIIGSAEDSSLEAGEYTVVLDGMADAMNDLAAETHPPARAKRLRHAKVPKDSNTPPTE
jgi:uncharacterized protein YodC (DUF2158 family)